MVTIGLCTKKKDLKLFERLPERIQKQEPFFVPPFPGSITKIFSAKHPFSRQGKLFPFLAWKGCVPVGRICAVVNEAHNKYYGDRTGFFGFFDCIEDKEVSHRLFEAAELKLREFGLTQMRGPYNPTINEECGVLAEGFDSAPFIMMPFNPSYYLELYSDWGFLGARDLFAFHIPAATSVPERIEKIVQRVKRTTGITFRNIDLGNLKREIPILRSLYNSTLDRNWGFVPITDADLEFAAGDLKAIIDPSMVIIAEKEGVPVGFSMTLPNINEFLWKVRKSKGLFRILRFVWYMKTKHPKEARLTVLGVSPEYRNKGIAPVFYYETLIRGKQKYSGGELSWVEETNTEMAKAIELMGGTRYKSYRIFEKSIGGNA